MFAEIALHRKVPKNFDTFTYAVPQQTVVEPGQLVQVPFRKQKLSGIVRALHEKTPPYPTKMLETASSLILPKQQIQLAEWMTQHYKCPFSKVIDLFLPEKVWRGVIARSPDVRRGDEAIFLRNNEIASPRHTSRLAMTIENLLSSPTPKLLLERTPLPREEFYSQIVNSLPKESQALFLFPELFHLKKFSAGLPTFHGELNETQKAGVWDSVRQGVITAIAGTRAALFLPFKNLSLVVLDFEHNESYLEKRSPYYDSLEVAEKLAELWNCPLLIISSAPRVKTWHRYEILKPTEWREKNTAIPIAVIDMANERRKGNTGFLSEAALQGIAGRLSQDEQILLFINRKGEAGALLCRDCGNIFRCESCSSAFAVHAGQKLLCHRCNIQKTIPLACDKCGNIKLKLLGFGTETLEKEIKKLFAKAKILRLDREILPKKKTSPLDEKELNKADIIIATQIIAKPLTLARLKLTIAVMPDPLLHFPEFRATERLFQLLTHLHHLTQKDGKFIIQTFLPDNSLFMHLAQNRIEDFYEEELKVRESLSLPPFSST